MSDCSYEISADGTELHVFEDGVELNNSPLTRSSGEWNIPQDVVEIVEADLRDEHAANGMSSRALELTMMLADENRVI